MSVEQLQKSRIEPVRQKFKSVSLSMRQEIDLLLGKLKNTDPHFVRCVKSNNLKVERCFDQKLVLEQLKTACTIAYANFMRLGYPVHIPLNQFLSAFQPMKGKLENICANNFNTKILLSLGLKLKDFRFGSEFIFVRSKKSDVFTQLSNPQAVMEAEKFMVRSKWKTWITCILFLLKCML